MSNPNKPSVGLAFLSLILALIGFAFIIAFAVTFNYAYLVLSWILIFTSIAVGKSKSKK